MARGNKDWGSGKNIVAPIVPTRWEVMLKKLGITEEEARTHPVAVAWARKNQNSAYIPEKYLERIGCSVKV